MELQQVLQALENADRAGDTAAASELANLARQMQQSGAYNLRPAPPPPEGGFIPAVQRGALQTGSLLFDILPAMGARLIGADAYAEKQFQEAAATEKKIQEKYGAAVPSYKDIKGAGDFVTYITESVGELVPSILPSLFTGGIAGIASRGAVLAAKEAAEAAARRELAKEGAQAVVNKELRDQIEAKARQAGIDAARKTATKYDAIGIVSGSSLQNIPEVYKNIKDETGQESIGSALLFGGFNSLLDAALPLSILTKMRKAGIPEEQVVGEWYKRFGKGATKGFATEGATEAAQEMSSAAAEKFVDENQEFFSEKNLERFINAGLKGGLGGGVVSGTTDVMLGKRSLTDDLKPLDEDIRNTQSDILARRAFLDELRAKADEEGRNKLDAKALKDLGFGPKYSLYESLLDKDINDPAQAQEVVNVLEAAVNAPETKGRERVVANNTLEVINQYLSTKGEPDVGQVVEEPSGAGAPVPTEPVTPAPAEGVAGVERTGVVPPVEDVGAPVGGEGVAPAPVEPPAPVEVAPTTRELIAQQETELAAQMDKFQNLLQQQVQRFGLKDVGVKVVDDLVNANGQYSKGLIKLAVDAADPVRDLRHESIHALKELGFFTPGQWDAMVRRANESWINTYLRNRNIDGGFIEPGQTSRYDAYVDMFKSQGLNEAQIQESLVEEAISDAFGDFNQTKAPPGMMQAILKRMKNFFQSIKEAVGFAEVDPERLFGKIERAELAAPAKPQSEVAAPLEKRTAPPETVPVAPKAKEAALKKFAPTEPVKASLKREAVPGEMEISTQNPQAVGRKYDPITQMLSIDEAAVREAMKENPDLKNRVIQAIKSYGFIPNGTPDGEVIDVFKKNIINNLLYLYRAVPPEIRNRSRLWYDGANVIANEMAGRYNVSPQQVAAIMAAMSPQKDWFQNVSMAERAIDILSYQGDASWTPEMLQYAKSYVLETRDRKEREKRQKAYEAIEKVARAGTKLKDMDEEAAAAFIRAYDEAFNARSYRVVTPEGGFADFVRNNDGSLSTLMWSTYDPIKKSVSIFRNGTRENISQQLGFEHKIRSFYNNIIAPNSDLDHVTIDTHAVAAGLFEALAGTDPEVSHNFGATGKSDVIGIGGTYGIIADAYRDAAKEVGVKPREMQSITWEAIRALFSEEMKRGIKPIIRTEWQKYKTGQQSFDDTRQRVLEIATKYKGPDKEIEFDNRAVDIPPPDWVGDGRGVTVNEGGHSYNKSYVPEGGVRLREYNELREKMTFNLSSVTSSIPGLRELYERAMKGKQDAYELLQRVAESSLNHYLKDSGARVKIDYAKGVFLSDREPSISVSVSFDERNSDKVLAALAQFADNYNQQQIHVRVPTAQKVGYQYEDGSYATPVYEIALRKELTNKDISKVINETGLQGFTVTDETLTAYWLAPTNATPEQQREDFNAFASSVKAANGLVGKSGSKPKQRVERLYAYGTGFGARIDYARIRSDIPAQRPSDTETPRLIAEYLTGEPVKAFKQKELTAAQKKDQELLARVYEDLPLNDLKRPIVKRAYEALSKALIEQYQVLPIKVELIDSTEEPYRNSAEMRRDVSENNRFKVYKTQPETFGPPGSNFKNHPLLKDSGLKDINGQPMLFNDLLRAVHDYFAHNITEAQFGPLGEAAAWRNHMATTPDPMARWALTAETRLQNAWQNFRRGAQDLTLMQRGFADQKAALPPLNFVLTGDRTVDAPVVALIKALPGDVRLGSLPPQSVEAKGIKNTIQKIVDTKPSEEVTPPKYSISGKRITDTPELREAAKQSAIVDADGNLIPMYHGTAALIRIFRGKQAGATFLSPDPEFAAGFTSASRDWMVRHIGQFLKPDEIRKAVQELRQAVYAEYGKQSKTTSKIMDEIYEVLREAKETGVYKFKGELEDMWTPIAFSKIPGAKERVMELYVLAKKPFDFESRDSVSKVLKQMLTDPEVKRQYGYSPAPAGVDLQKPENFMLRQTLERTDKDFKAAVEEKFKDNLSRGSWRAIETPEVQRALKALKFDSFYVIEGGTKNLGVYDPKLIKSADENVGPFGQRPPTEEEAKAADMILEDAIKAQEEGDIRFSLRAPQTPEFKRWFGDSKVVDANGEPLVVYHGTPYDFSAFRDRSDVAPNIKFENYFSADPVHAAFFARKLGDDRGQIMPVFLSIKNPMVVEGTTLPGVDEITQNDLDFLIDEAKSNDHDGVLIKNFADANAGQADTYITFESTQIKSATGNIGTFEPTSPDIRKSLRSSADPAINARILQTTTAREEKTFPQRITQALGPESYSRFRAAALNRYNSLGVADKKKAQMMGGIELLADSNAESAALVSDLAAGIVAGALGVYDKVGGVPVYNRHYVVERAVQGPRGAQFIQVGGKIQSRQAAEALARRFPDAAVRERGYTAVTNLNNTIKGPLAIFAPLAKLGNPDAYRAYQYWAGVKRGSKWMTNPNGQVVEQLFEKSDIPKAEKLRQEYLAQGVDFNQIQKEWTAYNDQLVKYMLDTGVISKENAKKFTEHGDYLPFYRQINGDDDAVGPRIFQAISAVKQPRKIKGGEDPLGDFLENMVRNTQAAVQAGLKNVAARRAADVGMDVGTVRPITQAQASAINSFYVLENGQKVFYDTDDLLFIDSIKSLGLPAFPGIGLLSAPASVLRNLVTKDPGFMLANMMRDSLAAWTTSGVNMLPVAATLKNFTDAIAGSSPEYKALLMAGVVGGYDYSQGTQDAAKQFGKELRRTAGAKTVGEKAMTPFTSLWDGLEKGTQASDAATRIEVYKQTLKDTGNEAEALFRALEVMNFNRKGNNPIVRVATAAIPFLNARMQGLDVLYRAAFGKNTTSNAQAIQRAFWVRGMTIAALSSMYWLLTHDDEEYKKQEQETRDNNWLFPSLGVRVPIPFEVGVLFKVIPERIMGLTFGDDTAKDFTKSMARNLASTLAVNPIPQTILPIVEATTNFSFFTFRPIVGQGLEGVAPQYQVGPGTSRLAEGIGSALNMSPMKIDQIIQGYTGTIGTYMSDLFESVYDMHTDNPKASKRFEQLPVVKRFMLDPDARGQVTAYYDLKNSVDEATRTANLLERSMNWDEWGKYYSENIKMFAQKDYILDMEKTMKEYRDTKNMIRNLPLTADQKRDAILSITKIENQLTNNIQTLKKQMQ